MARFWGPLRLEEYRDEHWYVLEDLVYTTDTFLLPQNIIVPSYFPTDLASIPHILRPIIRQAGTHKAAVLHDWLVYRNPNEYRLGSDGITRAQADRIFLEALLVTGVPKWKARSMYLAVRLYSKLAHGRSR